MAHTLTPPAHLSTGVRARDLLRERVMGEVRRQLAAPVHEVSLRNLVDAAIMELDAACIRTCIPLFATQIVVSQLRAIERR